jgi:molecular chaperone GrpE
MNNEGMDEPVTVTDKRRIDPQTGAVREAGGQERSDSGTGTASGPAPRGPAPGVPGSADTDKVAELTADLQRVQADFANYRKRALREQDAVGERAKAVVVSQLLPVLDDLERARSHGDLEGGPLKSVADKLAAALSGLGLTEFGTEGEEFDPSLHEAVQHEGDGSAGSSQGLVLSHVMRKGYKLGEFVLRPAMVGVVDAVEVTEQADTPTGKSQPYVENAQSDQ